MGIKLCKPVITRNACRLSNVRLVVQILAMALVTLFLSSCFGPTLDECEAMNAAEARVRDQLKCPSTAKFPDTKVLDSAKTSDGETVYLVQAAVDAENSFGAMMRSHHLVVLYVKGNETSWSRMFAVHEISDSTPTELEISIAKDANQWPETPKGR